MAVTSSVVRIRPSMAKQLLEKNVSNRKVTRARVEAYKRDLLDNRWVLNGSAITISSDDMIVDGQHRLIACVEANVPFDTILVQGVAHRESFLTTDVGRNRSISDVLSIAGAKSTNALGAAVSLIARYERGLLRSVEKITNADAEETYIRHPGLVETIRRMSTFPTGIRLAHVAMIDYLGMLVAPTITTKFLEGLKTGAELKTGSPALALRNYLMNPANTRNGGASLSLNRTIVCTKALNAAINGRQIYNLRQVSGENYSGVQGLPYGAYIQPEQFMKLAA